MPRRTRLSLLLVLMPVAAGGAPSGSYTDPRDGRAYRTVEIAGATWLAENLAYAADGSFCFEDRDAECAPRGRLYPWPLATRACPPGWHLSTEAEWQALERHLGVPEAEIERTKGRGEGVGDRLQVGGDSGLEIPFAGWRRSDGSYAAGNGSDVATALWTATEAGPEVAWHRDLSSARSVIWRSAVDWPYALSVRCVADDLEASDRALGAAWMARDVEALVSFYAADAVAAWTDQPLRRGREAMREFWRQTWSDPAFDIVAGERTATVAAGDVAFVHGTSTYRWTRDGRAVVEPGAWTTLWRRVDGRWQIAHEAWNRLAPDAAP